MQLKENKKKGEINDSATLKIDPFENLIHNMLKILDLSLISLKCINS